MRDRGAMLVFTVLVGLGVTTAVSLAVVPILHDVIAHQRAQSAADAAALAGVTGGRDAAAQIAAANDAELVSWRREGFEVSVTVRVGDQRAAARASNAP